MISTGTSYRMREKDRVRLRLRLVTPRGPPYPSRSMLVSYLPLAMTYDAGV